MLSPRTHLLIHYFSTAEHSSLQKHHFKDKKERLLHIQNFLNRLGATELFIHLLRFTSSDRVFEHALKLATTILDGGNHEIQTQFLKLLKSDQKDSEKFFLIVRERMEQAQQDLKNGSSVSTDDLLAFKRGATTSTNQLSGIAQISSLVADEMHDAATISAKAIEVSA